MSDSKLEITIKNGDLVSSVECMETTDETLHGTHMLYSIHHITCHRAISPHVNSQTHFVYPNRIPILRSRPKSSIVSQQLRPVCKCMNDIWPNSIFLSSTFEPSHEGLRTFVRAERGREHSRLLRERKPCSVSLSGCEDSPNEKGKRRNSPRVVSF